MRGIILLVTNIEKVLSAAYKVTFHRYYMLANVTHLLYHTHSITDHYLPSNIARRVQLLPVSTFPAALLTFSFTLINFCLVLILHSRSSLASGTFSGPRGNKFLTWRHNMINIVQWLSSYLLI